jgi:hypothetical protein
MCQLSGLFKPSTAIRNVALTSKVSLKNTMPNFSITTAELRKNNKITSSAVLWLFSLDGESLSFLLAHCPDVQ